MWLLMAVASLAMIFHGSQVHAETAMHQIYAAAYIVGGVITLALSGLLYSAAEVRRMTDERFRLEAPEAYEAARKQRTDDAKKITAAVVAGGIGLYILSRFAA